MVSGGVVSLVVTAALAIEIVPPLGTSPSADGVVGGGRHPATTIKIPINIADKISKFRLNFIISCSSLLLIYKSIEFKIA
jgi:hypothetical protein